MLLGIFNSSASTAIASTPLEWYPRLNKAPPEQRANFEIMPLGIRWPDLDEDLGIVGMLEGRRAR